MNYDISGVVLPLKKPKDVHCFLFFFAKDAGFETPAKVEASRFFVAIGSGEC